MVPAWSLPLFLSGIFAAPPVTFEGATDCPSHDAISRELERIVSAPEGSEPSETALVALEGRELRIVLTTRDGRLLGERRLPAEGTCDERALSVAVVLGAWIATAHPEYLSALPEAESKAPAMPAEESAPSPPPIPLPDTPKPRPPPPAPAAPRSPPVRTSPAVAWRFQAALGVGGELSDAGLVPAADISFRYTPEESGFGASAFVLFAGAESRPIGSGSVSSFRWPLGAGGVARLESGAMAFELDAGFMLGLLDVQGEGFSTNDGATDAQGGGFATLRVGAGSGRWRPFGAAKVLTWFSKATARASVPDAEVDLPAVEGVFLVGVGYVL
jgi:hypothetical protein